MAKKTAAPKKTAAKQKAAKPTKAAKPAAKAVVKAPAAKAAKAIKAKPAPPAKVKSPAKTIAPAIAKKTEKSSVKPALMTKKGKAEPVEVEETVIKKTQTVTSMVEQDDVPADDTKVEKLSKVKPIRVERGNVADEKAKWIELNKKYGKEKAIAYKMSDSYASLSPVQHKVLGWGFILTNDNDRLEVLFENGIRVLISNYKS
jgi:hypothetical protein